MIVMRMEHDEMGFVASCTWYRREEGGGEWKMEEEEVVDQG